MLLNIAEFPSFLKLNDTSLYVYKLLSLSIHLSEYTYVISTSWIGYAALNMRDQLYLHDPDLNSFR